MWTRDDVGVYLGTLIDAFTLDKTFVSLNLGSGNLCIINSLRGDNDFVLINANGLDTNPTDVDGLMQIEIRVYN